MKLNYANPVTFSLAQIVLFCFLVILAVSLYMYLDGGIDGKYAALFGGLSAGIIVAIVQFIFEWREHVAVDRVYGLGILRILPSRDDKKFYGEWIDKARESIDLMGVSASRFLDDFADMSSGRDDTRLLINALERGVKVRILLPERDMLSDEEKKHDFDRAGRRITELIGRFHDRLEARVFAHYPMHSVVRVDGECIVGPVFPNLKTRHTPAIHIKTESEFARKYLEYFEYEWVSAIARA